MSHFADAGLGRACFCSRNNRSVLPEPLRLLAYLCPTTLSVLALYCLVSLLLTPLRLDCRGRR